MNYRQQLADPRWQKRRLEILNISNWECSNCGNSAEQLHVHHPRYIKGRMAWEYADDELEALCKTCHEQHHKAESALQEQIHSSPYGARFFSGLAVGFLDVGLDLDDSDGVLRDYVCPDAAMTGAFAQMFFHAHRNTKAAIARALALEGTHRNPAEQRLIDATIGLEIKRGG